MQRAKFPVGDGGAADLLGAIGVWGPHDNIKLRQMGLTREFSPELEVQPRLPGCPLLPSASALPVSRSQRSCGVCSASSSQMQAQDLDSTSRPHTHLLGPTNKPEGPMPWPAQGCWHLSHQDA